MGFSGSVGSPLTGMEDEIYVRRIFAYWMCINHYLEMVLDQYVTLVQHVEVQYIS